jgi:SAM-dependent methyltransferase
MAHHHHPHHHPHAHGTDDEAALAELLDLDADVLHAHLSDVITWVHELTGDKPRRILDLGSGTGTGALALVRHFASADVIAVDQSKRLLHHLETKARGLGVADRIHTVQANLDDAWPSVGTVDLVWASASLHHLADPGRVLSEVFAALHPGGLLAVLELDSFPRFLPADIGLGRPGLEDRCHAAMASERAERLPHLGSDWGPRLTAAGFIIEAERSVTIELTAPLPAATGRYAQASLRRLRSGLDGRLSPDDLATLDTLITSDGPDGVLRRDDLTVRAARRVWLAQRP